jgi:hypothetical protein
MATILASHAPSHWTITCPRFYELRDIIIANPKLDAASRKYLIELFKHNTDTRCDETFT